MACVAASLNKAYHTRPLCLLFANATIPCLLKPTDLTNLTAIKMHDKSFRCTCILTSSNDVIIPYQMAKQKVSP